jgi:general stress protein 26
MHDTLNPIAQVNELMRGIATAILTTVRPDGTLHSCPMASRPADPAGVLWFLSLNHTEKVEAVRTNQRVNVAFIDPSSQRYVSVSGYCELVRDHVLAKELWDPGFTSWAPGGPEDINLVLMKVDIQQVESWDATTGRMVPLAGFPRQ